MDFNGNVGQVAGGDIYNYGVGDLTYHSREQVAELLIHLRKRLKDARRKTLFNPLVGWMVLGALTFLIELFSDIVLGYPLLIAATILYGPMIYAYRESITTVEIFQHSRGWV